MGLFSGITDIFSGGGSSGYGDMQGQIQKAIQQMSEKYAQGREGYSPYTEAGTNALSKYSDFANRFSDPSKFYSDTMSGWDMSPAGQMNQKYGLKAMNQSAAASGMLGSPSQQEQVGQFMDNLVNTDQQNYLNNILGIGNQYMGAQGNLMNQGFNAQNAMNQSFMGEGNALANLYNSMGQAQLQQRMAEQGGLNDLLGGAFSLFSGTKTGQGAMDWFSGL